MNAGGDKVESVSVYTAPSYSALWSVHPDMCNSVCESVYNPVCNSVHSLSTVDDALVLAHIGEGESCEPLNASTDEVAPSPVLPLQESGNQ
jgi:hypothetical protein